jgi:Secreted repeat of unknown function
VCKGPRLSEDLARSQARRPPQRGAGVNASLLGTTKDRKQVTYNGHPLYYFHDGRSIGGLPDKKPGQVNGQGVIYAWYVVSPKGNAIKTG